MKYTCLFLLFCMSAFGQCPVISKQPENQSDCDGNSIRMVCLATTGASFQWERKRPTDANYVSIAGATSSSYQIFPSGDVNNPSGTLYRAKVGMASCSVYSNPAEISLHKISSILNPGICERGSGAMEVQIPAASLASATLFQWSRSFDGQTYSDLSDDSNFSGTRTKNLQISNASLGIAGQKFKVRVLFSITPNNDNEGSLTNENQTTTCPRTSTEVSLQIKSSPVPVHSATLYKGCLGAPIGINSTGCSPYTTQWYDANQQKIGTGARISVVQLTKTPMLYKATCVKLGCESLPSLGTSAQGYDVPSAPVNAGTPSVVCPGNGLVFKASGGSNNIWYLTESVANALSTATTLTVSSTENSGTEPLKLTRWVSQKINECESPRTPIEVSIPPVLYASAGQSTTLSTSSFYDTKAFVTARGGTSPYRFQWSSSNNVPIHSPSDANPTFGPLTTPGFIKMTVTDNANCVAKDSIYISLEVPQPVKPNTPIPQTPLPVVDPITPEPIAGGNTPANGAPAPGTSIEPIIPSAGGNTPPNGTPAPGTSIDPIIPIAGGNTPPPNGNPAQGTSIDPIIPIAGGNTPPNGTPAPGIGIDPIIPSAGGNTPPPNGTPAPGTSIDPIIPIAGGNTPPNGTPAPGIGIDPIIPSAGGNSDPINAGGQATAVGEDPQHVRNEPLQNVQSPASAPEPVIPARTTMLVNKIKHCDTESYDIEVEGCPAQTNYYNQYGPEKLIGSGNTISFQVSYEKYITIRCDGGNADPINLTLEGLQRPQIRILKNFDSYVCAGDSLEIKANLPAETQFVGWEKEGHLISEAPIFRTVLVESEQFQAVVNKWGCIHRSEMLSVPVHPRAEIPTIQAAQHSICVQDSLRISLHKPEAFFEWNVPEKSNTIRRKTNKEGIESFKARQSMDGFCWSDWSKPLEISIHPLPEKPRILPVENHQMCDGETKTLVASKAFSYIWNTGARGDTIQVSHSGDFFLHTSNAWGCISPKSDQVSIYNRPNPLPPVLYPKGSFFLEAYHSDAISAYEWTWKDRFLSDSSAKIKAISSGTYQVRAKKTYELANNPTISCWSPTAQIAFELQDQHQGFSVYPNPSTGEKINIEIWKDIREGTLSLIDFRGITLRTWEIQDSKDRIEINITGIKQGEFVLRLISPSYHAQKTIYLNP